MLLLILPAKKQFMSLMLLFRFVVAFHIANLSRGLFFMLPITVAILFYFVLILICYFTILVSVFDIFVIIMFVVLICLVMILNFFLLLLIVFSRKTIFVWNLLLHLLMKLFNFWYLLFFSKYLELNLLNF